MKPAYGWTGKLLRVDLTNRKWSVEPTETYAERFIGGIGIGSKIYWDEVEADVGALDPENKLILAPGPLTGTSVPGSGRFELVSKSPRGYPKEAVTRSGVGGLFGPELKYAGYDALVIEGKADGWVNLWICNDRIEFRDASDYIGLDTYETQIRLQKELDPRVKILCIGPAGENLSRLAVILSETGFASGKSGFGAVMGAKNLKAIAVRGTEPLRVFDAQRLIALSKTVKKFVAYNPMQEWTSLSLAAKGHKDFLNKHRMKNTSCFGCPIPCFAYLNVPDVGKSQTHCTNFFYYFKATEFYGNTLERDQAVADGFILANRLGIDTFEFKGMLSFLEDAYKAGVLDDTSGLPFDKIGSREFIQELLSGIAHRKGIGDLLAEGTARAADHIQNGWEFCSKYFPAHGQSQHESVRRHPGVALLWALDSRDPIIDQHPYYRLAGSYQTRPAPFRLSTELCKKISKKIFGSEGAIDNSTYDDKPEAVIYAQNRSAVINILVVCDWVFPIIYSRTAEDGMGDTSLESKLLAAATGYSLTEEELDRVGERVWTLTRCLMMREGRTRDQDTLHESYFAERDGEKAVPKPDFERAKSRYYELRGWDPERGWPSEKKLRALNLDDVADKLTDRKK